MAAQGEGILAGLKVPHLDGVVLTPREQALAVTAQDQAADKIRVPSPLIARLATQCVCPRRVRDSLSVSRSQTLMVLSALPENRRLLSPLRTRLLTSFLCPIRVRVSLSSKSQTLIVISKLPENS